MDEQIISTGVKPCKKQSTASKNDATDPLANLTPCNYWDHPETPGSLNSTKSTESTTDPISRPPNSSVKATPSTEMTELDDVIVFTGKKKKKPAPTTAAVPVSPSALVVESTPASVMSSAIPNNPNNPNNPSEPNEPSEPARSGPVISVVTTMDQQVMVKPEDEDEIVFTGKRKPKKSAKATPTAPPIEAVEPDYSYDYLLGRLYGMMQAPPKVPNKISLVPPVLGMIGSKRTCIANFAILCNGMNREPDHVSIYLQVEFCTNGSLNSKNELTLRGKFKVDQIQTGITSYISRYVKCVNCKRYNTHIIKEERLSFLECLDCQAKRTVESVRPKKRVPTAVTTTTTN
jgi:translation initiation factor 2 subunit 2